MRYARFRHRRTRFTSLTQINQAFGDCAERINARRHSRFGVSRRERFETVEKAALKLLPIGDLEYGDWKDATLHPDCYVYIEGDYYSAPHIHRHKKLRIKIPRTRWRSSYTWNGWRSIQIGISRDSYLAAPERKF